MSSAGHDALARLGWYESRLRAMSPAEIGWRLGDRCRQKAWTRRRFDQVPSRPLADAAHPRTAGARTPPRLGDGVSLRALPPAARCSLLAAADELLEGRACVLGVLREDMTDPCWALDPVSGRTFPLDVPAFRVDYRSPADVRHVKQVWELSRHHHLTLLASAWQATGEERYATMVARHLRSWWAHNPILSGVNWASGIEVAIRLISWVWTRRLLDGWPGAPALFEDDETAVRQIYWHQRYLAAFWSRGSSANNHVIAEAAGLAVASCAFGWFAESPRWRHEGMGTLERELARNTFESGIDKEQAFEYHGFVAELGLVAAVEAGAAGVPVRPATWDLLCRMLDVTAATLDRTGGAPRYGDGDDGRALVVDGPGHRWLSLLAAGGAIVGPLGWWPVTQPDARSILLAGLLGRPVHAGGRPEHRPSRFVDAGLTILRSPPDAAEEIWCRCDGGPHGFLSIAAHAHADALSIEVRHDGVEVLVDPGTYCYQGEPAWREYFRSTAAHNTVEVDGQSQSVPGGPFLWGPQAKTIQLQACSEHDGAIAWSAEHDGYRRLSVPVAHQRTVTLQPGRRTLRIVDRLESQGPHSLRLAFHLGPSVDVELDGDEAVLTWAGRGRRARWAVLALPGALDWRAERGATEPIVGWYSPSFGRKVATTTLVGTGKAASTDLVSELRFAP